MLRRSVPGSASAWRRSSQALIRAAGDPEDAPAGHDPFFDVVTEALELPDEQPPRSPSFGRFNRDDHPPILPAAGVPCPPWQALTTSSTGR